MEEVRVGWIRGKKDGKMLLAILPRGDVYYTIASWELNGAKNRYYIECYYAVKESDRTV